jgi:hypothetical protein
MNRLLDAIPGEERDALRHQGRIADDTDWPYEAARERGWRLANEEYQHAQRDYGRREMQSLMAALHLHPPIDSAVARDLVVAAAELFLCTGERRMVSRIKNGDLRLYGTKCPLYEHFLDPRWHGLTACGCYARRRGWYEALGPGVAEDVVMNKKWGDPVCQLAVHFN